MARTVRLRDVREGREILINQGYGQDGWHRVTRVISDRGYTKVFLGHWPNRFSVMWPSGTKVVQR